MWCVTTKARKLTVIAGVIRMKEKYTALDIANFYVQLSVDTTKHGMDIQALNRLCFCAQAMSLKSHGYPLFDDIIEATETDLVIPSVCNAFGSCGMNQIKRPTYKFDESRLSSLELSLLTDIYMAFGYAPKIGLVSQAEKDKGTEALWRRIHERLKEGTVNDDAMIACFSGVDENEMTMRLNVSPENVVDYSV